jgi:ubiquinone biosynthesis UbiH/UbiF/VisC/COQ6 family hydroxylase
MKIHSDICIIGNGVIGKACALAMSRAGYEVALLAPDSPHQPHPMTTQPLWDQRVYALNHVARHLLSSLKVWNAMDSTRIAPVDAMVVQGDDEARPGQLGFNAYGARVGALAWIVEDSNLNRALDSALSFASGVKLIKERVIQLTHTEDHVQVSLDSGASHTTSLVIGADGAHSWVRTQADIGIDYRSYDQRAIVANFSCTNPHHDVASQWFLGADGIVALLPLPDQQVSLVWSAPDAFATRLMTESAENLCERLSALPGQTLGQFAILPPSVPKAFPLRLIRSHSLIAHRIALMGDAAHVVHPLAGQGMNLGFADIDALVSVLGLSKAVDCGDARLLNRYARLRAEDILLMQLTTDGLHRLFTSELPPVKALRNVGMRLVDKLPFLKNRLARQALGHSFSTHTTESF